MRISTVTSMIAAIGLTAAAMGCGPHGTPVVFDSQGTWGLNYGPTITFVTTYADASLNATKTAPITDVVTPPAADAGSPYFTKAVFFYDHDANKIYSGSAQTVNGQQVETIDPTQAFQLDANHSVVLTNTTSVTAIPSTSCAVSSVSKATLTFNAAGDAFTISESISQSLVANNSGSGPDCPTYLTAEKAKVVAATTTDIGSRIQEFNFYVTEAALNVPQMTQVQTFSYSFDITGTRINTSIVVPTSRGVKPMAEGTVQQQDTTTASAGAMERIELQISDTLTAQIFESLK